MENILVIGFFKESDLNRGSANWNGKYFDEINSLKPLIEIDKSNTARGIGYLIGKDNNDEKCFELNILDLYNDDKTFKINYIVNNCTEYNSAFIKRAVRDLVEPEKIKNPYLPLCVPVEKEKLEKVIDDETAAYRIKELMKKNDWQGIYNIFTPLSDLKNKAHLWNNDSLLNSLSFATAKLSETYIRLKFNFKSDEDLKKHLALQKKYRQETLMLRKRCIELKPEKPAYYSNLAYSHYQFVRELMLPGGRRDGNVLEETKAAIENIDKALERDPQRVTDLYRKGQLLTKVLPPLILFGGKNTPGEEAVKESRSRITDGINCFKKVEEVWEILPLLEDKMIKRYQKEYIKSMYDIARAYGELAGDVWNITQYLLPMKCDESNEAGRFETEKIGNLDKALYYMEKCAQTDNNDFRDKFPPPSELTLSRYNGICEGSHKLYSFGKYYFQKYLILTGCDEYEKPEAELYRKKAEEFFTAALRFPSKPENARQSKGYIAEKLARVYISKSEYDKAIEILKKFIGDRTDYYIRYTYATACLLSGKYEEAGNQSVKAMKFERSNLEMWLGHYLMYIKCLKENRYEEADINLKLSMESCKKAGKKNPDSLMIGQAYISYKKGDREEAIRFLRKAQEINPSRKGIAEKIKNWQKNEE